MSNISVYQDYDLLRGIKDGNLIHRPQENDYIAKGTARLVDRATMSALLSEGLIQQATNSQWLAYELTDKGEAVYEACPRAW